MQKEMLIMGGVFLAVLMIIIVFIVVIKKEKYTPVEYRPAGSMGYNYEIRTPFEGCADSIEITPQMMQLPEQTIAPSVLYHEKDPISGYDTTLYTSKREGLTDFQSELTRRY